MASGGRLGKVLLQSKNRIGVAGKYEHSTYNQTYNTYTISFISLGSLYELRANGRLLLQ